MLELYWVDLWRQMNVCLSVIALALLIRRRLQHRALRNFQEVSMMRSNMVWSLSCVVGAATLAMNDVRVGFNFGVPLATIACALSIYATIGPSVRFGPTEKEARRERGS